MAGTSFDVVVLSSSPPAHETYAPSSPLVGNYRSSPRRVAMPASPLLAPPPPISPQNKSYGASAIDSRKASIPPDTLRGFATVDSLVRSEHFVPQPNDEFAEFQQVHSRRGSLEVTEVNATKKKPRKQPAVTPGAHDGAKPKPKPRARKPNADKNNTNVRDPELRLPAPKMSPYFATECAELPIGYPNETAEPQIEPANPLADTTTPNLTKAGKPRKPRTKKEKAEGGDAEPKRRKSRVAKPKVVNKSAGKTQLEASCVESAHVQKETDPDDNSTAHKLQSRQSAGGLDEDPREASTWEVPQSPQLKKKRPPKQRSPGPPVQGLDLEAAVSRRREWTPPQDTVVASPFTDSAGKENKQAEPDANGGNFTHIISNFVYAQSPSSRVTVNPATSTTEVLAVTKRRRVELVDVLSNQTTSRKSSPEKRKAPKKRARTITDIATEQYHVRHVDPDPAGVPSGFFQPRATVTKVPLNDVTEANDKAPPKKSPRKRSTSKSNTEKGSAKAKSKKVSTKPAATPKPIAEKLLSPKSALLRLSKQDIMFGTSSQLALEESPTMVRQIQQAMKGSEQDADISPNQLMAPPLRWPKLEKVVSKRGLWDASSRDIEGGLLDQMEDVYIPEFDRTQEFPLLINGTNYVSDTGLSSFVDIDDLQHVPAVIISSDLPTPPRTTTQGSQTFATLTDENDCVMADTVFEDIDSFDSQPPPSNQNVESQNSFEDIDDLLPASTELSTMPPPKPRPPAAPATSPPKKRRGRPPKSQYNMPMASMSPMTEHKISIVKTKATTKPKQNMSAPSATPPKASGRFIDIDEILDSEDETREAFSPTPPRVRKIQDSDPLPLASFSPMRAQKTKDKIKTSVNASVVQIHSVPDGHLKWASIKGCVFQSITAHIRSIPPTTDPKKPSWHEKILMYDPIVLEDFTTYLNVSTVVRTWKRATKVQIRAWNKAMKAIGEKAAECASENEVLAVEKELEAWQVQAWCECMSVCCIWGEGRGKGGVRKGLY